MRMFVVTIGVGLSISLPNSVPALAQAAQSAQPQQQTTKPAKDPNEIICEKQTELGSRLATQRVCKTRAQWAEERLLNRQQVEKVQISRDLTHPQ